MPGKTNLKEILHNINPRLLDETFVFITSSEPLEDLIKSLKPKATFLEDDRPWAEEPFVLMQPACSCIRARRSRAV